MKNLKFKIKNVKLAFVLLIVIALVVLLLFYHFVLSPILLRSNFANHMITVSDENETPIFGIQKILVYSSANAVDNSENQSLKDLSISQFSDLSIHIDNSLSSSELTDENTVKELYIDNISMTTKLDKGDKILNYKNALKFGEYKEIIKPENDRIDFKVVNTNEENQNFDYDEPVFYTDCSNPITLGYLNKDLLTGYSVSEGSTSVSFNGKVLKEAGIKLEDINYTLNFTIHIVNNLNQKFAYNMKLDVNLGNDNEGIYGGYVFKGKNTSGTEYQFFKEV